MRYLSVCSGIEAATVAWHPLGWEAAAFSEIEAFPRAVLSHRYPHVPLHGDFTTIKGDEYGPVNLLVGGTPCQSFSVAGLRGGLADDRGNLALEYLRLADRARPRWLVWENVPGVLSSNGGRDFGSILGGMGELGYGFAYRVLDAQHFGVPQRRRRVFVVGYLGNWRRAAAVLFERHGLSGHSAPRRQTREGVAPTISARPTGSGGLGTDFDCDGGLVETITDTLTAGAHQTTGFASPSIVGSTGVARTLMAKHTRHDPELESYAIAHALRAEGFDASEDGTGRGTPLVPVFDGVAERSKAPVQREGFRLGSESLAGSNPAPIAFSAKDHGADAGDIAPTLRSGSHSGSHASGGVMPAVAFGLEDGLAHCLRSGASRADKPTSTTYVATGAVRRLTPLECERLQGFPDGYTDVPYRGKPAADGPRYKALGNSMAVPCMRWIGERIAAVEAIPVAGDLAHAA